MILETTLLGIVVLLMLLNVKFLLKASKLQDRINDLEQKYEGKLEIKNEPTDP